MKKQPLQIAAGLVSYTVKAGLHSTVAGFVAAKYTIKKS